ncbi:MAG: hypothetical protein WC551_02595 [Patescibacteria group bacterium]
MPNLSKQQVKDILQKAPANLDKREIVDGLVKRGYILEGLNDSGQSTAPAQTTSTWGKLNALKDTGIGKTLTEINPIQTTIGAVKGFGSTLLGAAKLGSSALKSGYDATIGRLTGKQALDTGSMIDTAKKDYLTPTTTGQKIGFGAEQIGEFFLPGGMASKATKGVELTAGASKLPTVLKGATKLLSRAAIEGTGSAGVAAAQEGEINKNVVVSGAIGAGSPVLEKAGSLANRFGNLFYSWTVPTTITEAARDMRKGLDIGKAVSDTGVSFSRKEILTKLQSSAAKLGKTLDNALGEASGKKFNMNELLNTTVSKLDDGALAKTMKLSPIDIPTAKKAIVDRLAEYQNYYGSKVLEPKDLQTIKVGLGDSLEKVYKQSLDVPVKAKALADMSFRSTLKKAIEDAVPLASPINKELAPILEAQGRILKKGAYSGYLTDIIAGSLAAGSVGDIARDPVGYIKRFAGGVVAKHVGTSVGAKTISGTIIKDIGRIASSPVFYQAIRKLIESSYGPSVDEMSKSKEANSQ